MSPAIRPRLNRTDTTLSAMRGRILAFYWPPGTLLAEAAVARELEVSRVPVREALFCLERDGLVEFSASGRAYVRTFHPEDVEELFTLRLTLEPAAARMAVPRLTAFVGRLEANIKATRSAASLAEVTRLDLDFHDTLFEAAGHRRLARLWRAMRHEIELWLAVLHRDHHQQTKQTRSQTADSHAELLECLRSGTPSAAERLMRTHILGWREWLPQQNMVTLNHGLFAQS
jgi:DNA-binding GntR family transcriptional regulator